MQTQINENGIRQFDTTDNCADVDTEPLNRDIETHSLKCQCFECEVDES